MKCSDPVYVTRQDSDCLPGGIDARQHKQLPEALMPHEMTALQRQIEATDGQDRWGPGCTL